MPREQLVALEAVGGRSWRDRRGDTHKRSMRVFIGKEEESECECDADAVLWAVVYLETDTRRVSSAPCQRADPRLTSASFGTASPLAAGYGVSMECFSERR